MLDVSAECPGFQLQNREVVGLRQTAVIKGETGAASAQEQPLVHPQTKVTTEMKRDKLSFLLQIKCTSFCVTKSQSRNKEYAALHSDLHIHIL